MTSPQFDPEKHLKDILDAEEHEVQTDAETSGETPGVESIESEFNFDIKPQELEEYLNKYVIDQSEAIEVIATKVCTHFNRMKIEDTLTEDERLVGNIKSNILMIGPTGVGKTFIIKLIAKKIGVPFVKADATKFSETGYVGGDVEDLVRELVHEAEGDVAKAEYGIIYIDEIDKIASSGSFHGPDVSRTGVQRNLLKLMEEADVDLKTPHDLASQVEAAMEAQKTGKVSRKKINTKNILFIVSGAFGQLDEIINRRLNRQAIGFDKARTSATDHEETLKHAKTEDLIEYGFESEFVGRLPVYVVLNTLDENGLYKILNNEHSTVILGKKLDFRAYGIELDFKKEALRHLARRAYKEKTGARGLLSVFERALIKYEKRLPSTEIKKLTLTDEILKNPEEVLEEIIAQDGIDQFKKSFLVEHGIYLNFDKDSIKGLKQQSIETGQTVPELCDKLFHDYFHGIRLMNLEQFTITKEAVVDPETFMDNYVKKNLKK